MMVALTCRSYLNAYPSWTHRYQSRLSNIKQVKPAGDGQRRSSKSSAPVSVAASSTGDESDDGAATFTPVEQLELSQIMQYFLVLEETGQLPEWCYRDTAYKEIRRLATQAGMSNMDLVRDEKSLKSS